MQLASPSRLIPYVLATGILGGPLALAGCGKTEAPAGPPLSIAVAPLELPGLGDADYTVTVKSAASEVVWTRALRSSAYGDGAGSLSYVGTCDAASQPNTVELSLDALRAVGGATIPADTYANPTASGPLVLSAACVEGQDNRVEFNLTVARQANQGFFDIAISFKDIFCSAKLDCGETTAEADDLRLLHDASGARATTAVLGFACTASVATGNTVLYLDNIEITCAAGSGLPTVIDTAGVGMVQDLDAAPNANPDGYLFAAAVYRGQEGIGNKRYWNVALGLNRAVFPDVGGCTLATRATASDALFDQGTTPAGTTYPLIQWNVPLSDAGGRLCTSHPVNGGNGVAVVYTGLAAPASFDAAFAAAFGTQLVNFLRDLDGDGVDDAADSAPANRFVCRDVDGDGCDDCTSGVDAVADDGPDFDGDGLCDAGDPDDDGDGVLDGDDSAPLDPNVCRNLDGDGCDDCGPVGATCDDGSACTTGDVCVAGLCTGEALTCDDGNGCTDDTCAPATGCVFTDNTAACDDGDACTTTDACAGGVCVGGTPLACDDGNACTDDACDPVTGCTYPNNDANACSDNNACTPTDTCSAGVCVGSGTLACSDGNACTDDACNPATGCVYTNDDTNACSDNNLCTTTDACSAGACVGSGALVCDDGNPCTDDACDPGIGCTHTNNTASCDDSNACTPTDTCSGGTCVGSGALACNDGNACTDDACSPATGCVYTNDDTNTCSDNNLCTPTDTCSNGSCVGSGTLACNDGNVCTDDACTPTTGCTHVNNTISCNDNNACTTTSACSGGSCIGSGTLNCDDGNVCTNDACTPSSGCTHVNNTIACVNTSDGCALGDYCSGGTCIAVGNVPCGGCFVAGTPVATETGARAIEAVRVGDRVLSVDEETGRVAAQRVLEIERKWADELVTLTLDSDDLLTATSGHPLWTERSGWVPAKDIVAGDVLRSDDGRGVGVRAVRLRSVPSQPVYNLIVDATKTYFVGGAGVLAHTCDFTLNLTDAPELAAHVHAYHHAAADPRQNPERALVVYDSRAAMMSLVRDAASADPVVEPLSCLSFGAWAREVGVKDDHLVVLDQDLGALHVIPLEALREVVTGERTCVVDGDLPVRVVPLPTPERPFDATLGDGRVVVSYGISDRLAFYDWIPADPDGLPDLSFARIVELRGPTDPRLGLSGLALADERLLVAASGWVCAGRDCPRRFEPAALFDLDLTEQRPLRRLQPADLNTVAVYQHQDGTTWAINAGDFVSGHASVQRVGPDALAAPIDVGPEANLGLARPLDADRFVVLQMAGDRLFVVDTRSQRVAARLRFDGVAFHAVAPDAPPTGRADADLQDMTHVPDGDGALLFVDSKHEQLVHARPRACDPGGATCAFALDVVARTPLGLPAQARTTPSWLTWLVQDSCPGCP